ncbi:MAG: tryptophan--tRNA ligase [Clostridia bacterium]|nr:tryptophan--tRNA ligase [Clostridia bacterium]
MEKKTLYTAIKPTGVLTLGGYIGVAQSLKELSEEYNSYICIADLHALTINPDPAELRENSYRLVAMYLAVGLDPDKCTLYVQSHVDAHSKVAWVLNNYTMFGEASRMTQFKDYQAKSKDTNVGIFDYPVLMAGDILLYDTDIVPVGLDQKQHVELARNIAIRFNHKVGETFVVPDVVVRKNGAKICGLQDPTKKMSKSDRTDTGCIYIEDSPEVILKKVKKAVTDSEGKVYFDPENKPGVSNLLTIYSAMKGVTIEEASDHFKDANYGTLKTEVAESIISNLEPVQKKYFELLENKDYLDEILVRGRKKAEEKANAKITEIYSKLGLVLPKN